MATSLLNTPRFRTIFLSVWLVIAVIQAFNLRSFGFTWEEAAWDAGISGLLLMGTALIVNITLQFYIPARNKYSYILALCAVLSLLWFFVSRSVLMAILSGRNDYEAFFSKSLAVRLAFGFLVTGIMALISVLWYTIQDQQEAEGRQREADKLSKEAELFKLRQQLQPHFLFNSLNSINALIGMQPQQARTMIQQLSDFLRGTLKKDDQQWTSLEEELQHLHLYLEIEKVRFGHRLKTAVENEAGPATLPSMLLQPVVENAIKFGLYDTTGEILITIRAYREGSGLLIRVTNPYDPETASPRKGTGFGLSSVQRRLYLLFARHDLLKTEVEEQNFITTINIPQHDQGHTD